MKRRVMVFALVVVSLLSLPAEGKDLDEEAAIRPGEIFRVPEYACGAYARWDSEKGQCWVHPNAPFFRSRSPLRSPLPPPDGMIVLYPDGQREEMKTCPKGYRQATRANKWRFCVHPRRQKPIPQLWLPPIAGIPYEEVKQVFKRHEDALWATEGVLAVGLGADAIYVFTKEPKLIPKEVDGIPIKTPPLLVGYPL